jgi:hypothetical protein
MFDSIAENDLIGSSTPSPWMGYIWNSKEQRYEWLLAQFKTLNECQLSLEQNIGTFYYTRPVGCAYNGNNLLRVRIMNALYGGANYTCIAESGTPAEAEKIGMRYGPAIGRVPADPNSWHCVDTRRNFELTKGPAYAPPPPSAAVGRRRRVRRAPGAGGRRVGAGRPRNPLPRPAGRHVGGPCDASPRAGGAGRLEDPPSVLDDWPRSAGALAILLPMVGAGT